MAYVVAVKVQGEANFTRNGVYYATETEATSAGNNLMGRWFAAESFRVEAIDAEPNYQWIDGSPVRLETTEVK